MRAVIQRVKNAQVLVDGQVVSQISKGLLVLIGIGINDTNNFADYIANKINPSLDRDLVINEENNSKDVSQRSHLSKCRGGFFV